MTLCEGLGFLVPVAGLAGATVLGLPPVAAWLLAVCCGAGEGAMLGLGQSTAMGGSRAEVNRRRWILATATAAAVAWGIGMLPSTLSDIGVDIDWTAPLTWIGAGSAALVLLATIPVAQWPLLRERVPRAWRWIPLNMGAWCVGLVFTFLPGSFVDEHTPAAVMALAFALAGVCMAATVAAVTGLGLARMMRTPTASA
ncbi:MAG TPA: hypothetical protein VIW24_27630 [Aldersonia sp.]